MNREVIYKKSKFYIRSALIKGFNLGGRRLYGNDLFKPGKSVGMAKESKEKCDGPRIF